VKSVCAGFAVCCHFLSSSVTSCPPAGGPNRLRMLQYDTLHSVPMGLLSSGSGVRVPRRAIIFIQYQVLPGQTVETPSTGTPVVCTWFAVLPFFNDTSRLSIDSSCSFLSCPILHCRRRNLGGGRHSEEA